MCDFDGIAPPTHADVVAYAKEAGGPHLERWLVADANVTEGAPRLVVFETWEPRTLAARGTPRGLNVIFY